MDKNICAERDLREEVLSVRKVKEENKRAKRCDTGVGEGAAQRIPVLRLDFVPAGCRISFRYVFGCLRSKFPNYSRCPCIPKAGIRNFKILKGLNSEKVAISSQPILSGSAAGDGRAAGS